MGDLWLWLPTRLLKLKILLSCLRERMGQRRGTRKGKEGRPHNTLYTGVCQAIPAICTMLGISQITGNVYLGLSQKHSVEWTPPSPSDPVHLPSLSYLIPTWFCLSYRLSQAFTGAFFYGFSIQQMFLFHGWAEPTTACLATDSSCSPHGSSDLEGRRPEAIRGIHRHKLSLRSVCLAS